MASDYGDGADGSVRSRTFLAYLRVVGLGAALAASGFVMAILLQQPLGVVFLITDTGTESPIGYAALTAIQAIGFALVVFGFMYYADHPDLLDVRWPSTARLKRTLLDLGWVILGLVGLFVFSAIVGVLLSRFGIQAGTNRVQALGEQNPRLLVYLFVLSFLAVGPGEELLFRGGVQGVLRRVFSPVPAIAIASLLFGLAHVTAVVAGSGSQGVLGYVVTTFMLGAILGSLYEYTDNLLVPIAVHGTYNAILFMALYVRITGGLPFVA